MDRRGFITGAAATTAAMLSRASAAQRGERPLRFVQITDTHFVGYEQDGEYIRPRLPAHAIRVWARRFDLMPRLLPLALKQIEEEIRPEFLLITGDQCDFGGGAVGKQDQADFAALMREHTSLECHYCFGNHDADRTRYQELFGPSVYHFDRGDVRFCVLDSGVHGGADEEAFVLQQLDGLRKAIGDAGDRQIVCVLHMYLEPENVKEYSLVHADRAKAILLQHPRAVVVLNGHHHPGRYSEIDGLHFYTASGFCEAPFRFHLHELSREALVTTPYAYSAGEAAWKPEEALRYPARGA